VVGGSSSCIVLRHGPGAVRRLAAASGQDGNPSSCYCYCCCPCRSLKSLETKVLMGEHLGVVLGSELEPEQEEKDAQAADAKAQTQVRGR
jgi:hypothetical protein